MKKIFMTILLFSLMSISFPTTARACQIYTANNFYEGYNQLTLYNSCGGYWAVWTYTSSGWTFEDSFGNFELNTYQAP